MAATDKPYRSPRILDIVFAASCVLLLIATLWMLMQDYFREFKTVQRDFRYVETALNERAMLKAMPDIKEIEAKRQTVADARKNLEDSRKELQPTERRLAADREQKDNVYRTIKADYDSRMSYLDIE